MATSIGGAMFVKAIDANGNIKDADYVANIFLSVIEEIGKQNIVQIITDNGSSFKAARLTIERDGKNPVNAKARKVKQLIINDVWWDDLDYLLSFIEPIVDMLRAVDTDAPALHSIYDIWDTMIENVKAIIFEHEDKDNIIGQSNFFDMIHEILEARWTKSNTSLHCIAHSLVPKYYHESWLQGGSNGIRRLAPPEDEKVSTNRSKCFERLFQKIQLVCEMFMLNMVPFQVDLAISINHMLLKQEFIDFCMIVGGNGFDIDGSPIEFAELSINEHELELVTFDDAMEKATNALGLAISTKHLYTALYGGALPLRHGRNSSPVEITRGRFTSYLEGAVHFAAIMWNSNDPLILSFDLSDDVFQTMMLPNGMVGVSTEEMWTSVFGGLLSLLCYEDAAPNQYCSVWIMKEYGLI
ncbi:hypothetical protein CsSME_00053987 [Camellia sinensis var. sinensis]